MSWTSMTLKHTCSWHDKLIVLWILNRQAKISLCKIIHGRGKKLCKPKIQKESKYDMIKNVRNLFKLKKEKESKDDTV